MTTLQMAEAMYEGLMWSIVTRPCQVLVAFTLISYIIASYHLNLLSIDADLYPGLCLLGFRCEKNVVQVSEPPKTPQNCIDRENPSTRFCCRRQQEKRARKGKGRKGTLMYEWMNERLMVLQQVTSGLYFTYLGSRPLTDFHENWHGCSVDDVIIQPNFGFNTGGQNFHFPIDFAGHCYLAACDCAPAQIHALCRNYASDQTALGMDSVCNSWASYILNSGTDWATNLSSFECESLNELERELVGAQPPPDARNATAVLIARPPPAS